jgi:UBX domain-containing protein 1/4
VREALQTKERIKEAEKKRKEKREDELARKKILDQIARDKAERKRKAELEKATRSGAPAPAAVEEPAKPAPAPAAPKPAAAYTEARLRLQMPSGMMTKAFPVESTLFEVAFAVKEEKGFEVASFTTNFPKKTYDTTDFGMTLKEAGMVPSAALILK